MAHWLSETVLITQLEIKKGRWVIGNIGFTRHGQEYLTKLARDIIADDERSYSQQQSASDRGSMAHLEGLLEGLREAISGRVKAN